MAIRWSEGQVGAYSQPELKADMGLDISILFLYSAVQPDSRPKPAIDPLAKKKLWDDLHADC